jgi:hypothetical protein
MSNKVKLSVSYESGVESQIVIYDSKNYKDVSKIEDSLEDIFPSGDYGATNVDVMGIKSNIDFNSVFIGERSRLDQEMVTALFEEDNPEELFMKLKYMEEYGEMDLDDIYVVDASGETWEYGNYQTKYPESFVESQKEDKYSDLQKALEKQNAESYFDWARLISDDEINGGFSTEIYGDYFVYSYN